MKVQVVSTVGELTPKAESGGEKYRLRSWSYYDTNFGTACTTVVRFEFVCRADDPLSEMQSDWLTKDVAEAIAKLQKERRLLDPGAVRAKMFDMAARELMGDL